MGNYIDHDDVYDAGVPKTVPSDRIDSRILKWEAVVEQLCGQVFRTLTPGELTFDGNNAQILHFNMPLIAVTSVKINGEDTALDADDYTAYTGTSRPQDDRKNPRIKLTPVRGSIFRTSPGIFVKGLEQKITATWGFLDGGSAPQPVLDVLTQLVILDIDGYYDRFTEGASTSFAGLTNAIRRERTDGHEIEYAGDAERAVSAIPGWSMIPSELAEILALYRSPLTMGAPEPIKFIADPGVAYQTISVIAF